MINPQNFYGPYECFLCIWKLDTGSLLTIVGSSAMLLIALGYVYYKYRVEDEKMKG